MIISISGLRGIIGAELTPDAAVRYAAAYANTLPEDAVIVVGRDGRTTGPMLRSAIMSAIAGTGRTAVDVDVAATPTIGVLVRARGAQGAIQITASHNPPPYNGMKLFGSDGRVIGAEAGGKVRDAYHTGETSWVEFDRIGMMDHDADPHAPHLDTVLKTVDAIAIRAAAPKVLVDSNHGSGGILARRLLTALGCEVVMLGEEPHGRFAHVPEPTAENLESIRAAVIEHGCVAGFCQDPDADRLAIIDEKGRYIGEEFTLAICVKRILSNPQTRGPIVINGATSGMSERIAAEYKVGCHRSAVGEANVADKMIEVGAVYGGEGNGGPIDPAVGYVRDSFVAMAQVLDSMVAGGKKISQLADELPQLHIHKTKSPISSEGLPALFEKLIAAHPEATAETDDGLRLAWPDKWLLVRGSNTEPIVRFISETESAEQSRSLCETAQTLAESL